MNITAIVHSCNFDKTKHKQRTEKHQKAFNIKYSKYQSKPGPREKQGNRSERHVMMVRRSLGQSVVLI